MVRNTGLQVFSRASCGVSCSSLLFCSLSCAEKHLPGL
jgi:hypothetical protein